MIILPENLDSRLESTLSQDGVTANQDGYILPDATFVEQQASPLTNLQCGLLHVARTNQTPAG